MVIDAETDMDATAMLQTPKAPIDMIVETVKTEKSSRTTSLFGGDVKFTAVLAEYVAMVLFVVIGCGSAMGCAHESCWILQVALTFGLANTSLAYAIGHYSGGQINCAVTFGLVLSGHLSVAQGIANFLAQMLGSIIGAILLTCITPQQCDKTGNIGSNTINQEKYSRANALFGEGAMTALLMFVVLETAINPASASNRALACVAIGFAVFLAHSVLIPIDGCSINPTRSFGPALISKIVYKKSAESFKDHWVFWLGPLAGASTAVLVSNLLALLA